MCVCVGVCVCVCVCACESACVCVLASARSFSKLPNPVIHLHEIGYEHYVGRGLVSHMAILSN